MLHEDSDKLKLSKKFSVNIRALINVNMMILNCKIKIKSEILTEVLDKNHMTLVIHVTHEIFSDFLDKTAVDQKTVFSSKNTIITEKIIFVLNAAVQIIQLKTANTHSIQIRYL